MQYLYESLYEYLYEYLHEGHNLYENVQYNTSQDYHSFDFGQVEVTSLHILTRGAYDQDGGYKVMREFHL